MKSQAVPIFAQCHATWTVLCPPGKNVAANRWAVWLALRKPPKSFQDVLHCFAKLWDVWSWWKQVVHCKRFVSCFSSMYFRIFSILCMIHDVQSMWTWSIPCVHHVFSILCPSLQWFLRFKFFYLTNPATLNQPLWAANQTTETTCIPYLL